MTTRRPTRSDAADYYFTYIDKTPDGDIVDQLDRQIAETRALIEPPSEDRGGFRYQPGKWSVKQVLGHMADAERVFAYRALAFSRGDEQPIPGMDQDPWAEAAGFENRSLADVLADLVAVRKSTVTLFRGLSTEQWQRRGTASELEFQVGAIAWIIAGHELHHRGVLVDKYGISP